MTDFDIRDARDGRLDSVVRATQDSAPPPTEPRASAFGSAPIIRRLKPADSSRRQPLSLRLTTREVME